MSKIVFFCIPAHGHINPTLEVVKELVSRGHEVWYYSYNILREKIEEAGAKFVSCDAYDCQQSLSPEEGTRIGSDIVLSTRVLVETTLVLDDIVCRHMEEIKPDCIVADSMAIWGKAAAMKLRIPFVSSTTTFAFNKYSAKSMRQSAGQLFSMIFSMLKINPYIKRLKDKGYPVKNILDIIANDKNTHTIVYTSPEFQPFAETFGEKYAFVGPCIRPPKTEIEKTSDKLIYVSMGTVNNDMMVLYKNCIETLGGTSYQVIMSVGNMVDIEDFGGVPENISIFSHVDQIAVLRKADIFITHCGMNSVSEALYYGIPLIMLPQTSEQRGVANRTEELGAGIILKATDPDSIGKAVELLMTDDIFRHSAECIAESFRSCPGAVGAADKILSVSDSYKQCLTK